MIDGLNSRIKQKETEEISKEMTEQQAYDAVVNYCYEQMPMLYDMSPDEYYYWIERESTDTEYVIAFRSYTGAFLYYYVNKQTGNTRETEYVPGIVDEETPTGVTFNAWNYIN